MKRWIWEYEEYPNFTYDINKLIPFELDCIKQVDGTVGKSTRYKICVS